MEISNTLTWDLIPVSKEEFELRVDPKSDCNATMDTTAEDCDFAVHYTTYDDVYLGTIKSSDDGVEYLIPEEVFESDTDEDIDE